MRTEICQFGDVDARVIWPHGCFDYRLQDEFRAAFDRNPSPAGGRYVVDFSDVERLDSSGLGMLLMLWEHTGYLDASVQLTNCSERIQSVLSIANFDKLFSVGTDLLADA